MNTLQSFWNFFLNISLLDNTLDVTNEKKKSFFSFMRCGLRILQLQKRFFMLLLFNVQLFIFFDAINRSISLRAKLYFTIWKLQHITLVREKSPKIPSPFLQYLSVPRQPVRTSDHEVQLRYEEAHPEKEKWLTHFEINAGLLLELGLTVVSIPSIPND